MTQPLSEEAADLTAVTVLYGVADSQLQRLQHSAGTERVICISCQFATASYSICYDYVQNDYTLSRLRILQMTDRATGGCRGLQSSASIITN